MKSPRKKFHTAAKADRDIIGIYKTGVRDFGYSNADSYLAGLYKRFDLIAENPQVGRPAVALNKRFRRYEYQSHVIFYTVKAKSVFIVRILHERMDPSQHV